MEESPVSVETGDSCVFIQRGSDRIVHLWPDKIVQRDIQDQRYFIKGIKGEIFLSLVGFQLPQIFMRHFNLLRQGLLGHFPLHPEFFDIAADRFMKLILGKIYKLIHIHHQKQYAAFLVKDM